MGNKRKFETRNPKQIQMTKIPNKLDSDLAF